MKGIDESPFFHRRQQEGDFGKMARIFEEVLRLNQNHATKNLLLALKTL